MPSEKVLRALYERVPRGMRLGLEPMREACARAGFPERAFDVVHVAGTNGKGSVSAWVDAMAAAAGVRSGLYTSPHLSRFAERIRIGGEPIDDGATEACLEAALTLGPDLSFFETATLAAFLAFREARVSLAILEVGLGGRLDATNVVPSPKVGAITRIAEDHTAFLGDTLVAIGREKAGIAKPGMPLLLGRLAPDVEAAVREVADARGATVLRAHDDAEAVRLAQGPRALAGAHQADNAVVAAAVGLRLGFPAEAVAQGLASARWPGRLETVELGGVTYLLDAAHNPDGVAALVAYLAEAPKPRRDVLLFGALDDKAWVAMIEALAPHFGRRHYAPPRGRAPASADALAARAPGTGHPNARAALAAAAADAGPGGRVVVCGSIYLVGEARAVLLGLPEDPPVAL